MSPTATGMSAALAVQLVRHRLRQLDAGDRDAAGGQRDRDPAGADGELERGTVSGQPARKSTAGSSTSGANMKAEPSSYVAAVSASQ